jgi:hypothetical protein
MLYSWANLNAAGTTKRVVTTASLFVGREWPIFVRDCR